MFKPDAQVLKWFSCNNNTLFEMFLRIDSKGIYFCSELYIITGADLRVGMHFNRPHTKWKR